jgi:iron-sulfur cluster assembly protein
MNDSKIEAEIVITEKAATQIKKVMEENKIPCNFALRVGVKGGGCSGLTYVLGFDEHTHEGDTIIDSNNIKILVDGKSLFYLSGTKLDFTDGLNGKGFVFNNPNAEKECGCGDSFSV